MLTRTPPPWMPRRAEDIDTYEMPISYHGSWDQQNNSFNKKEGLWIIFPEYSFCLLLGIICREMKNCVLFMCVRNEHILWIKLEHTTTNRYLKKKWWTVITVNGKIINPIYKLEAKLDVAHPRVNLKGRDGTLNKLNESVFLVFLVLRRVSLIFSCLFS